MLRQRAGRIVADARGVAALEFAFAVPLLVLLLGGVTDFALAFWTKGVLASSVAQGAQYAFLAGPGVSVQAVEGIVAQKLSLPASNVMVTAPACQCVGGTPVAATSQACGQTCPDGTTAGPTMIISASVTYRAMLPLFSQVANPVLVESATVRLK
jgi:Flp pilus assembly protein TadG